MSEEVPDPKALSGVKSAAITTAQVMMNPRAYLDWRAWGRGLYSSWVTAFATSITSWLTTNGVEGALPQVQWLKGIGMDWKTALAQALVVSIGAAAKYISVTKGLPPGVSNTPFSLKNDEETN